MQPFEFERRNVKPDAIIAFVLGVVAAYIIQMIVGIGTQSLIFQTLIVTAVGGLWYHWRKVL